MHELAFVFAGTRLCIAQEVRLSPMAVNAMAAAVPLLLALSSYLMHPLAGVIGERLRSLMAQLSCCITSPGPVHLVALHS